MGFEKKSAWERIGYRRVVLLSLLIVIILGAGAVLLMNRQAVSIKAEEIYLNWTR